MHALQIEVCRPLYMDEAGMTKLPAFDDMQRAITVLVGTLADLGPALAAG
jgi:N-formylglutamate amidohydrolase